MSRAEAELEALAQLAIAAQVGWRAYEATEAALASPTMRSAATESGPVIGGEHSDPVLSQVLSHERYFETAAQISEALGILRSVQKTMNSMRRNHAETHDSVAAAVAAARCDGVVGDDPTCTRNAVRDVMVRNTEHPTCWACIKRAQRADEQANRAC